MEPLDRTDRAILAILQQDARISNKEMAARVGLAPSSCSERLRRLDRLGVFRGFHASIDPEALGIGLEAMVSVRLRRHGGSEVDTFRGRAADRPEVVGVFHVTGATDFLVHVVVRDAGHLRDLVVSVISSWPEVGHIETSLVFDHLSKPGLPDLGEDVDEVARMVRS
ncbi:MAG: Lrp/AsnC family transcriptional regulator [Acidimicrobiia bacterium]|nr:Lrp/AsnC family transcriptional regulator [Acidimicrobiia bacterium]